jgi:molybdopterin converting factor small subunit
LLRSKSKDEIELADEGFASSWDLEDKEYVHKRYFANIRKATSMFKLEPYGSTRRMQLKQLRDQLVEEFRERLRRRYNDQTVYDFNMKNRHFEPQKVAYKWDRVTNDGMARMYENVTGENGTRFSHFVAGDGNSDTYPNTKSLDHEIVRVQMIDSDTGFFTASGTTLNASGFFSESIQTFAVREVGATDNGGAGVDIVGATTIDTFLFRSVFPATDIVTHTLGGNFTTCVHSIYSKSV